MGMEVCGTRVREVEARSIEDFIGRDGIDAFVDRALELGSSVSTPANDAEVAGFTQKLSGSYANDTGLQRNERLGRIYLPLGYVNVHVHDAATGELLFGIYDDGRTPVDALSVALAIAIHDPVFEGRDEVVATAKPSGHAGVLGVAIAFNWP